MKLPLAFLYSLTILLYITLNSSSTIGATLAQAEQSILEVTQDKKTGFISVSAKDVSLNNVMQRISQVTGLTVKSSNPDILNEYIEIDLKDITLKETIDRLLAGVNSVFFYSSKEVTVADQESPRLSKVMILSRKEEVPSRLITNQKENPADSSLKGQAFQARLRLLAIVKSSLGNAILQGKMLETRRILQAILESGTEEEIQEAIEALGDILTQPDLYNQARNGHVFFEALEALKKLDPQGGAVKMTNLLQSTEEPWVQSLAAQSLGELGQTSSIAPLTVAFAGNDPLVQDAAAASLAQIATDIGVEELFKATANEGPALQQEIINALVLSGNEKAQEALDQAIAQNLIPAEMASEEAVAQLIESENIE